MKELRTLCGCDVKSHGTRLSSIQRILGTDIERYGNAVLKMKYKEKERDALQLDGWFAGRKMLEAGCVSLLANIDPTRLLVLREFQLKGKYELGERHPASVDWKNDIISPKAPAWTETVGPDKFVRSLLGGHMAEVAWTGAISGLEKLPEKIAENSKWIEELVKQFVSRRNDNLTMAAEKNANPDLVEVGNTTEISMLSAFRTTAQQIFSTLSKGVHLEFIVDQSTLFDAETIVIELKKVTKFLSQMAFTSHLMDCSFGKIDISEAGQLVLKIEREIDNAK